MSYSKFLYWSYTRNVKLPYNPIRSLCGIRDPSVQDLDHPTLTRSVSRSLDSPGNSDGKFALAVLGDFRGINPATKRTWSCDIVITLLAQIASHQSCACKFDPPDSNNVNPCPNFFCPLPSGFEIRLSTTSNFSLSTVSSLSLLTGALTNLPSRAHEKGAFHVTITSKQKSLSILCIHPELIISPDTYHSFVGTRCFLDEPNLWTPTELENPSFAVVGVLGRDYTSFRAVKRAMAVLANSSVDPGYSVFSRKVRTWFDGWEAPVPVVVQERKGLISEKQPRRPATIRRRLNKSSIAVAAISYPNTGDHNSVQSSASSNSSSITSRQIASMKTPGSLLLERSAPDSPRRQKLVPRTRKYSLTGKLILKASSRIPRPRFRSANHSKRISHRALRISLFNKAANHRQVVRLTTSTPKFGSHVTPSSPFLESANLSPVSSIAEPSPPLSPAPPAHSTTAPVALHLSTHTSPFHPGTPLIPTSATSVAHPLHAHPHSVLSSPVLAAYSSASISSPASTSSPAAASPPTSASVPPPIIPPVDHRPAPATPRTPAISARAEVRRFPFGLELPKEAGTLREISLKDLTALLLLCRQKGRTTRYCKLWEFHSTGENTAAISFAGQRIHGLTLRLVDCEPPRTTAKMCAFGCATNAHLSNTTRATNHQKPRLPHGRGECPAFPKSLACTSVEEFLSSRNLADLGGLEICYRMTNNYPNYLTNMLSLGLALLSFAIRDLGLEELRQWSGFEQGAVEV